MPLELSSFRPIPELGHYRYVADLTGFFILAGWDWMAQGRMQVGTVTGEGQDFRCLDGGPLVRKAYNYARLPVTWEEGYWGRPIGPICL